MGGRYQANGEAASPAGWGNLTVGLQGKVSTLPVAVLQKTSACSIVLCLNSISSTGKVISVADKEYTVALNLIPLLLTHVNQVLTNFHRIFAMKKTPNGKQQSSSKSLTIEFL